MPEQLNTFYNGNYHGRRHRHLILNDEYFWARSRAAVRFYFSEGEQRKRIFEYGCGIGQGIALLPNAGGWDISREARDACRRRQLKIYDHFEDVPRKSWDIIFCRHVLEHVTEPLTVLRTVRDLLVDDGSGELYLILPKERYYRSAFEPDLNQHLYCWNFRTINNLLHRAGFVPYRNYVKYIIGYRKLLPVKRLFGKDCYYYMARLLGWLKRNGELVIRARLDFDFKEDS